jgi:thymidylate synthase
MVAQQCDLVVADLIISTGDTHLYLNHIEQAKLQLSREPFAPPTLVIKRKPDSIFDYQFEDFEIVTHPHIKAEVAV